MNLHGALRQDGAVRDLLASAGPQEDSRMARIPPGVGPTYPQVVVLFGATGDLSRRKLLPGLFHLASAGFIPDCGIVGVSLDEIDADAFRQLARGALDEFFACQLDEPTWANFAVRLDCVPLSAGAAALRETV